MVNHPLYYLVCLHFNTQETVAEYNMYLYFYTKKRKFPLFNQIVRSNRVMLGSISTVERLMVQNCGLLHLKGESSR